MSIYYRLKTNPKIRCRVCMVQGRPTSQMIETMIQKDPLSPESLHITPRWLFETLWEPEPAVDLERRRASIREEIAFQIVSSIEKMLERHDQVCVLKGSNRTECSTMVTYADFYFVCQIIMRKIRDEFYRACDGGGGSRRANDEGSVHE